MAERDLIGGYLAEVSQVLGPGRGSRDRILAEIESHLRESAEAHAAGGAPGAEAQRRAVTAFGDPGRLALAFRDAQQGAGAMGPFIRYSGLLGLAAPVVALAGVISWSWWSYATAMVFFLLSALAMVAAQPRDVRWVAAGAIALVPVGLMLAPASEPVAKVMVFGGFLGCAAAFLAGRVLPRAAVLAMAGGAALFGAGAFAGVAELPMWLQAIAFALIAGGWMWSSWTLWRSGYDRSAVPPEPASA